MHLHLPRSLALAAAIAAVALAALSQPAGAHGGPHDGKAPRAGQLPPDTREQLREARRATRAFRDVDAARAAGYAPASECATDPKYGGMGIHYANEKLIADGKLDITRPEILVYQPTADGHLRLGALEYFQSTATRTLRRPTTGHRCSACPSTARCSGTRPACRSTTTSTSGCTSTTPRASSRRGTRA